MVDGIRYPRFGIDLYYAQELFEQEELTGYLKNTLETQKPENQDVVYDSAGVERGFAEDLETNEAGKILRQTSRIVQGSNAAWDQQFQLGCGG
ncbi:MAG: hypothetical protein MUO67_16200 [Anaerolineales bacterium]|nr:hypothetical protein [Anaerolineales bacterium]